MIRTIYFGFALLLSFTAVAQDGPASSPISGVRQLTFEGLRAGEGYFNATGTKLVFQSERMADNPFYQIYWMDLEMGDITRISPGHGKTTCAWIHPDDNRVMYASTQDDPQSTKLQKEELEFRASGQERRYSWDYDEQYEIYESDLQGSYYKNLTGARGYDAEGSYSPDGKLIAFASNRHAYIDALSEEDADLFEMDKSYMMDIYIMNADGSNVKRLTHTLGYDGGPFFSPDGERITWRRFAPNGATAEIFTMKIDGTDQRRITRVNAMSWAPYYHPSGDYLIFTNNSLGFANFELFIVDTEGLREPVRVTHTEGFDGLPVFHPDGDKMVWTTNRNDEKSQIFFADWDDAKARQILKLDETEKKDITYSNAPDFSLTKSDITTEDMKQHITFLASDQMEGRGTGTNGEWKAAQYVADQFKSMGLLPAGDNGTYFQEFDFIAGVSVGNSAQLNLSINDQSEKITDPARWNPLAYSGTGEFSTAEVVFGGYGIHAPEKEDIAEYDSYVHLDVNGKWVMLFRYFPEDIVAPEGTENPEEYVRKARQHLHSNSDLRRKAMTARDNGAKGVIIVSGPNSPANEELVPMQMESMLGGTSIAVISITDKLAQTMLDAVGKNLGELQTSLDDGSVQMGFAIEGVTVGATVDILQETRTCQNVLARLNSGSSDTDQAVVVGAHLDHLGIGRGSSSLARDDEVDDIHYGADDNASGVAGVLEIAQYLSAKKADGTSFKRDLIFAAWSGEEIGLRGARHFTNTYNGRNEIDEENAQNGRQEIDPLYPQIAAYLNMDMIGRLEENTVLQGVGSSSIWPGEIEKRNVPVGLSIKMNQTTTLPTDTNEFYPKGVPILNAFTGAHEDYHSPRDTADKINFEGAAKIARFMGLITRSVAMRDEAPDYVEHEEEPLPSVNLRAYLGTIPDYAEEIKGLKLSGVTKGAPAEKAGLKANDIIVQMGERTIENIYDYTYAIEDLRIGEETDIVVMRDGERVELKITPASRD
jgi:Tol biopolymer transport system component